MKMLTRLVFAAAAAAYTASATHCQAGDGGIKNPQPGQVITANQPFNLTYCAYAYYKTRTISIDVVVYKCGNNIGATCPEFTSGDEIVHNLSLVPGEEYGYHTYATVLPGGGGTRPGQWAIGVLEHTTGFHSQFSILNNAVPVTFQSTPEGYP